MTTRLALIAWWMIAGPSGATAQEVVGSASWTEPPDPHAVGRFQPTFAAFVRVPGTVELVCEVRRPGPPEGCVSLSVQPEGMGYEVAALQVASTGWLTPGVEDGGPGPGQIRFKVQFHPGVWPEDDPAAPVPQPAPRALDLARRIVAQIGEGASPDWEPYDYPDLAPERRPIVRDWMHQLVPVDREKELEIAARFIAARVSLSALEAYWAHGDATALQPEMETVDQYPWPAPAVGGWTEEKIQELRGRYCAVYDCREAR